MEGVSTIASEGSQWMMLLRMLGSLAVVLAVIYGISWLVKRFFKPENWARGGSNGIKVLQSFSLETKKKLIIVEVEGKRMLLGVGDHSINYLSELEPGSHYEKGEHHPMEVRVENVP